MLPQPVILALSLAGRPWTVWVVAVLAVLTNRASGANGFDAVILSIWPATLWMGISWLCRLVSRFLGDGLSRSRLPVNRPMPAAQLAVIVTPASSEQACPALPAMTLQLPEDLRRLMTPKAG